MAENPKYQRQNIQYEGAQPYDLANLRESIRLSKSTEAGLNRISEFAFKAQSERAKKAGLEYGVANPPTIVQISEAQAQGKDIKEIFSEDYTVFGEAARAGQASALRTDLEGQARDEFSRISAGINTANMSELNIQEIRGNLDAIIQGHSKVLAQLNPEESLRYRQSVTVLGHAVYKTALDRIENLVKAENIVKVDESINTLKSNIPSLLDTYPTLEEFKAALSLEKNSINEKMMNIDPNKIPEYTKEIDKVIKTAVIDHVGKYILNDLTFANTPGEAAMKILDGQAGDKTQLLNEYLTTPEDRMEVVKKLTEKKVAQINLFESVEKTNKKLKEDEYRLIMRDYSEGKVGPQETINALKAKGIPISNDEFKAIMEAQDANEGNLKTFSNMMNRVNTDTLSIDEIDTAAKTKRITFKQALDLKEKYFTRTDNDREVKNSVMNVIGTTSEELMTKPEKALFVAKGIEASTKEIKELRAKGVPFNIDDIAKKNTLVVMDTVYTQDYKDAQAELRRLSSKYKFTYSEDAYSPKQVDKMFKDIPKEDRRLIKQSLYEIQNYNNKQRSKASQ
jgi:hypothetical protein